MAKENGFSSVSELLLVKGAENFGIDRVAKDTNVSLKTPASTKVCIFINYDSHVMLLGCLVDRVPVPDCTN